MDKIGVGITTYNRPYYLQKLVSSLTPCKDIAELIVINDGNKFKTTPGSVTKWIDNEFNLGVGKSKNKALKYLLDQNCNYIFLIEDDVVIKNINVFKEYINASVITGIQHLNYGPGSPFNRKQTIPNFDLHNRHLLTETSSPNPKLVVDYKDCKIELYQHIAGVFSFFTRSVLNDIGLIDEEYKNAWEHVDHTNRIINAGGHPPFWWFADIANSIDYLDVQPDAIQNSTTSKNTDEWLQNVQKNAEIYKRKNGHHPAMTPMANKQTVLQKLKQIKNG